MMAKRSALHFLCALLLLVAQHGALTHSVWHLGNPLPAQEYHDHAGAAHGHDDDGQSSQSKLCDLHAALGTLLAGGCAGQPAVALTNLSHELATAFATWRVAESTATPRSRAPPVLL
jgi:hypothetical protein